MNFRQPPHRLSGLIATAWLVALGISLIIGSAWAQTAPVVGEATAGAEREPPAPSPLDAAVSAAVREALEHGKAKQYAAALERLMPALENARKSNDLAGEALVQARRGELLLQSLRAAEAAEAWTASALAWNRAGYAPGSVEGWWRASLCEPINSARAQAALARAAEAASADRLRPLASAEACRKGARILLAAKRPLSAKRLFEEAVAILSRTVPESQAHVRALIELSDLLRERGDYEPAAEPLRRALEIAERRDRSRRLIAEVLNKLSVIHARQGRLADAEKLRVREVELRRELEPDSAALANSLLNYALIFTRRGEDLRAEQILQEVLPLQEKHARRSSGHASTLETLGLIAVHRSQWKTSERLQLEAYEIRNAIDPDSVGVSTSLINLASIRIQLGDWATAERYLARALAIRQKRSPGSVDVAHVWMAQANLAGVRGDLPAARRFREQALRVFESRSPGTPDHALALIELGQLSYREGDLPTAWKQLAEGVTMLEKETNRTSQLANGLVRLANVEIERGDFGVARTHLIRGLSIYERQNARSYQAVQTLTLLGRVAAFEDEPAAARGYLERAQKILQDMPRYRDMHARVLSGLAELSLAGGRPAEAAPLLAEAVALLDRDGGYQPSFPAVLQLQADCFAAQGRKTEAETAYRQSLELWEKRGPRMPGRAQTLYRLALLLRPNPERRAEAVQLATQAWDILQQQGEGIAGDESLQAFVRMRAPVAAGVASMMAEAGQVEKSLQILEENRAQGLRHLLDEQQVRPAGVPAELWQSLGGATLAREEAEEKVIARANALTQARLDLGRVAAGAGAMQAMVLRQRVEELEESLAEAERSLAEARDRVQRLWSQVRGTKGGPTLRSDFSLSLAHTKNAARGGAALLYYSVGEDRTLLFFVPPGTAGGSAPGVQVYSLPMTLSTVATEVGSLVVGMREAHAEAVVRSRQLSEKLFPPAVRTALGRARRMVIIPDGPLWELPFAALVLPGSTPAVPAQPATKNPRPPATLPPFLGLQLPMSIEASLALFADRERSAPAPAGRTSLKVLAMGEPLWPAAGGTESASPGLASAVRSMLPGPLRDLAPIPGTRADAQSVARLYGVQPLLAESASEAAVRAALPDADVVHFATHGYLHPFWSRASGLVLSREAALSADVRPESDGLLQSWEIYGGPRLRADLVVLAACETGTGTLIRGEGVNSLSRAFRAVGARSVVASLWKVRDDSTRQLMLAFHQRIRQGVAKDEAMQLAMKEVAAKPGLQHPYHWGAFLLVGDRANHLVPAPAAQPTPPGGKRPPGAAARPHAPQRR